MCNCDVCAENRIFRENLDALPEAQRPYFEALYEAYLEAQLDRDYYKAVVRNEWPDADRILARYRPTQEGEGA